MNKIREACNQLINAVIACECDPSERNIETLYGTCAEAKAALAAEPPCKTEGVTVREAFAMAGYPVPEGAIVFYSIGWHAQLLGSQDHYVFAIASVDGVGWMEMGGWWEQAEYGFDTSNLPAKDCLDALPECVRAAITPPTEDRAEGDTR